MNKVILTGFIGKDAELKNSVANFTLATSESYTKKDGTRETETEWHNIKCFGQTATFAEKHIKKGEVITVEGKIKTEKWDAQDGTKKEYRCIYATSIIFTPAKKRPEVTHNPEPQVNLDEGFTISDNSEIDLW